MRTYTTCPGCGEPILHAGRRGTVHAGCVDPAQWIDDLEEAFLSAVTEERDEDAVALGRALDNAEGSPPRYLAAALAYAAWGWPVHPLFPGSKVPATGHGFRDATTSPEVITAWWAKTPNANIGLATGHAFDVLDIDMYVPGTGLRWADLRESDALPTTHGIVSTARGGLHVYLLPTLDVGNQVATVPGIDWRGRGGYVVAPPSRLDDTAVWTWSIRPSPYITTQQGREPTP
jgi:hypothetical protein